MQEFMLRDRFTSYPVRLGLGLLLCANYSCSNSRPMASMDPFQHSERQTASIREEAGTTEQQAMPEQARHPSEQFASLEQSVQQLNSEEAARVRVAKEWPALPEKRIGLAPPTDSLSSHASNQELPAGGYEHPLNVSDPWPVADAKLVLRETEPTPPLQTASIEQVSHAETTHATAVAQRVVPAVEFTPAEPRVPIQQTHGTMPEWACPPGAPMDCPPFPGQPQACQDCDPRFFPDEYLCDGGDRGYPVHYGPGTRNGLETQDTIAEFYDETGKRHVQKTNEVCTYAPRFGAVRTVTGSSENVNVDRALGSHESVNGLAVNTRIVPIQEQQNTQLNTARVRSRPSGLETEDITLGVNQATKLENHSKLENTNTDYAFAGQVALDRWESPVDMTGIQSAAIWTRKQSPVILASDVAGTELYSWFKPEELVGLEDKSTPGRLYIDKSADRGDAQSGDVITFTIRFRNTGDRSLSNIQIIDNLTPRLEFIEGSATSTRDGRLVVEDNQEGSLILKWELAEDLKGRTGGTVTFQARVR
ncbi:MAG: hypothetical protein R3C12_18065 [Planctomycetaceae bacterium]|nr:DUF11 domain-containing protein [Planctomycetaceae bacterium]